MVGWGGVGGVVQTDYLVEPRLSWTGLGCDNYALKFCLTDASLRDHLIVGPKIDHSTKRIRKQKELRYQQMLFTCEVS